MSIEAKKLFGDSIMNPNSNSRINQNDDEKYYGSGFNFRPDVLCDLDGKLRNWRKGLRLKSFSQLSGSLSQGYIIKFLYMIL